MNKDVVSNWTEEDQKNFLNSRIVTAVEKEKQKANYLKQFKQQSISDDTMWRKQYEARELLDYLIVGNREEAKKIIFQNFGVYAQFVKGTAKHCSIAIHAPNMALINIPIT